MASHNGILPNLFIKRVDLPFKKPHTRLTIIRDFFSPKHNTLVMAFCLVYLLNLSICLIKTILLIKTERSENI